MDPWAHQTAAVDFIVQSVMDHRDDETKPRMIITTPTGGGKSLIMVWAMKRLNDCGIRTAFAVNRRFLVGQFRATCESFGLPVSVLASGYDDGDYSAPNVICASDTLVARILKKIGTTLPDCGAVFFDEAHLQCNGAKYELLDRFTKQGAMVFGVTATPLGMQHAYDGIRIFGTASQLRKCGALLPAMMYGPDEPDLKHIKKVNLEFVEKDVLNWFGKNRQQIFGRVLDYYHQLNADGLPTILFAPGLGESVWFADELTKAGVKAVHIDGEDVYEEGVLTKSDHRARQAMLERIRQGEIKIVCNRFVMREGVDLPEFFHEIIATPIGSLRSYLQVIGRVLRFHSSLGERGYVVIQDHGGNWHRHGSPNADQDWESLWSIPEKYTTEFKINQMAEGKAPEPICCPNCTQIRSAGRQCPGCGMISDMSRRSVWQMNGELRDYTGKIYKAKKRELRDDTAKLWKSMVFAARNSKSKSPMSFYQAEALFYLRHDYWPSRTLPYMPKDEQDWYRKIRFTSNEELIMEGSMAQDLMF